VLSEHEARELARAGKGNTAVSGSTRTTARILRTTVFSFYNNTLFIVGIALLALGRYGDALVSVGLGIVKAALAAFQELRAKRQLDRLQLLAREPVTVIRDDAERQVTPAEVVEGDVVRVGRGEQIVVDGPLIAVADGAEHLEVDKSLLTGESGPPAGPRDGAWPRKGDGDGTRQRLLAVKLPIRPAAPGRADVEDSGRTSPYQKH
jgi:cation-transporting ATPase E